jgi:hypothetical protein
LLPWWCQAIDKKQANAVYARGGANATPLALPELLDVLVDRLAPEALLKTA